jgi:hypothetical protein
VVVEAGPDLPGILADPPVRWIGLSGLVRTGLHNEAHLWLSAGTGEPLLAGRRVGAGRAVAFASQLAGDWTAAWQGFDDGGRLFAAAVAWATRRERGGWEVAVEELHDGQIRVVLDAVDGGGRPVSELTCRVEVDLPGGGRGQSVMSAVAPGRYRAVLDAPGTGVISATVLVGADVVGRAAMLRLSAAELRDRGDDLAALEAIAEAGGGEVLSRGGPPPSRTPAPPGSGPAQRGWPMLLAIALYMAYLRDEGRLAQGVAEAGRRL